MRLFAQVERRNNYDIAKKIEDLRIERNWGRSRPKEKRMEIIREDIRACGIDEDF